MTKKKYIVIAQESVALSWARDASTFVLVVALIGVGVLLDSGAMQWIGAIFAFLAVLGRADGISKPSTIEEAREILDQIERERVRK